jgi:hypothetical protein
MKLEASKSAICIWHYAQKAFLEGSLAKIGLL